MVSLLKTMFESTNNALLKNNKEMPWTDDYLEKAIIGYLKKRIDVLAFRSLLTEGDPSIVPSELDVLLNQRVAIRIYSPDNIYLVLTELGIIVLNMLSISGDNLGDIDMILHQAKDELSNIICKNLSLRCSSVFDESFSSQEAILALFLLLNGAVTEESAFRLQKSSTGYLYGEEIVNELNHIYGYLTGRWENRIRDQKEFRDVVGRNGKNGRLAKSFSSFRRATNRMWFEPANSVYNSEFKNILSLSINCFINENEEEQVSNNVAEKLIAIIEEYTVMNPLPLYIRNELFMHNMEWDYYLDLLNLAKNIWSKNENKGNMVATFGVNIYELQTSCKLPDSAPNEYAHLCDWLEKDLMVKLSKMSIRNFKITDDSRDGETFSIRISYDKEPSKNSLDFADMEWWEVIEIVPYDEIYPNK